MVQPAVPIATESVLPDIGDGGARHREQGFGARLEHMVRRPGRGPDRVARLHCPAPISPAVEPLALYIHWPFCLAKCPYCDFNSHVREVIPQARFAAALRRELRWEAARLGRRRLASIFFGGGTPSLMAPETVAALIAEARRLFEPAEDIEI